MAQGDIEIYGAVRAMTGAGKAAYAQQVYDEEQRQFQSEINQNVSDMISEVFPLTVGVASSNVRTYEIGTEVNPQIVLSITRKGADVSSSATTTVSPSGSVQADNKTIIDSMKTSGTTTYQISVAQGGQTRSVPAQTIKFLPYAYGGTLDVKPANANAVKAQIESWGSSHGVLTDKTDSHAIYAQDGKIPLSAKNYYLFAVKGSYDFIVKNAASGGIISVDSSDMGKNLVINRVNGTGTDNYSWIIVPESPNSWTFEIVNS